MLYDDEDVALYYPLVQRLFDEQEECRKATERMLQQVQMGMVVGGV